MKNSISEILYNYPIHVKGILTLKSERVWEISCTDGIYILKSLSYPKDETYFILEAMDHLSANGFHNFNQIIETKNKEKACQYQGQFYFLTKKLKGEESDFTNESKIRDCCRFLGRFHKGAQGFKPEHPYKGRLKWNQWPQMMNEKDKDIYMFPELAHLNTDFDKIYARFVPYFAEEIEKAKLELNSSPYKKISHQEKKRGGFCHHDLAHHNFIMAEKVNIIDFDYAIADIRCHDLANFFNKVLKANNWDIAPVINGLREYDKINPLSQDEEKILIAFLSFPQDFWQCGLARYRENDYSQRNTIKLKRILKQRYLRAKAIAALKANL